MNDEKKNSSAMENAATAGAAQEIVQRYGSAAKEHFFAYSGVDNETGERLKKGLKDIAKSKINPDYREQNRKQQAGFSAENKYTARQNAERIINGDASRVHNTDIKGSGNYNELFDHIITDKNGNVIGYEQMKFVGSTPKAELDKLASQKFQKYLDADATITVPKDFYAEIKEEADKQIESLNKQLANATQKGNGELAETFKGRIAKYEKIKASIKDSGITNKEAMFARLHPALSTAHDVAKISHGAGLRGAAIGATIAGASAIIQNLVAFTKGEKTADEAGADVALAVGKGAATGYATAFAGSAIKGAMQNSKDDMIKAVSKTNFPAQIVAVTVAVGKTMKLFISGEIDGVECLSRLGEQGCGMISSSMFATVGGALGAVAGPVGIALGGMVGSMVGYVFNSAFYGLLKTSLEEAKFAREERIRIEAECAEAIERAKRYQAEMQAVAQKYFFEHLSTFNAAFNLMDDAIASNDIDLFIKGNVALQRQLGHQVQFTNFNEFDGLMTSSRSLKL